MLVSELQPMNALSPMSITEGSEMLVSEWQSMNALIPMIFTVFGAMTAVRMPPPTGGITPSLTPTTLNLVPLSEIYPFPCASTNGGMTTRPTRCELSPSIIRVSLNGFTVIVRLVVSGSSYLIPCVNSAELLTEPSG